MTGPPPSVLDPPREGPSPGQDIPLPLPGLPGLPALPALPDLPTLPPPPPDSAGLRAVVRFLKVGILGVVLMFAGIVWDAVSHLSDPVGTHRETGLFDWSNPSHLVLSLGGALVVGAVVGAMVRARALVKRDRRPLPTAVLLSVVATLVVGSAVLVARADDGAPQLLPSDQAASEAHGVGMVSSHAAGPCRPSRADRVGAERLIRDTQAGAVRFTDPSVARAEGYVPGLLADKSDHWLNPWYQHDGDALDATKPEVLIYTTTPTGIVLTGAMYLMNVAGEFGPELGGCLTRWHVHANLCFSTVTQALAGEVNPDGTCAPGTARFVPPPALHVFFYDIPDGRFAPEINHEQLLAAVTKS